jgi:hypothetical protein
MGARRRPGDREQDRLRGRSCGIGISRSAGPGRLRRYALRNWASSVEPFMAVVDDWPAETVWVTSSK